MRTWIQTWLLSGLGKPCVFALMLLPALWLVAAAALDLLGANPAQALVRSTGDWTLRALCVVLSVTPVRTVLKMPALARYRRMLGLFVYFYAVLHMLAYGWFDMGWDVSDIAKDIAKRPFILVGFLSLLLLTSLALTSFNRAIKTLGAKNWRALHRLVYAIAGLALLHFFWMRSGKHDYAEVAVYAALIGVLLGWRVVQWVRPRLTAQVT
jgi:sulfoxide reductase heme-binding subunit YedZ